MVDCMLATIVTSEIGLAEKINALTSNSASQPVSQINIALPKCPKIARFAIMRCNQKLFSWLFTTPKPNESNQKDTIFHIVRHFSAVIQCT